ncbi:nucleotidyl transferase AbiEii/AbiGii toxin family protein [Acidaminobacter sp.]|uniref:nucleotidyl transferase AbiEii/AbiGii toxin family protein n=1 Tax=Acidaminobacter sp. TaxID=1872102 RepID=UPI0025C16EEA|nr:nucleotidyl transferase AbiEii/AbiGii toxin family protein [Acidaminobacter sp.]
MSGKAMSLKAKIRNMARIKDMSAQVVLQNYMFERFLERLSKSEYQGNFIIKGGLLIAALVGIGNRATMDMDATIKNYPLNVDSLTKAIKEICSIPFEDDVSFTFYGIEPIRDDDEYGGYRVSIISEYDKIRTPMQIDITTGDVITPKEVLYLFKRIFGEGNIGVWAYNIETVLAEKVETILSRGELNTRPRDFYDVYILTKTQKIEMSVFEEALRSTASHRQTTHIFQNISNRLDEIRLSNTLRSRWMKYTKDYRYAKGITYEDVMESLSLMIRKF